VVAYNARRKSEAYKLAKKTDQRRRVWDDDEPDDEPPRLAGHKSPHEEV
jgi:hypothetical protein